jgi:hypothetical protein
VPFNENPSIMVVDPAMGNPMRAGIRWTLPAAGNPNIATAIPAVIAVDPNESALGRSATDLDDGGRRPDPNYKLRE